MCTAYPVAQVLLTLEDTESRRRFLNAKGTLEKLLEHGVVPVINENDTVATDEIRYGDNDRLAARVAQMVMADGLLLLSDIDGLYTADPAGRCGCPTCRRGQSADGRPARHGRWLAFCRWQRRHGNKTPGSTHSHARRVQHTHCTSGKCMRPIAALAGGARCTIFHAQGTPAAVRQQWLAGALKVRGALHIDAGAAAALSVRQQPVARWRNRMSPDLFHAVTPCFC
jgi:glutamate 5-kinase